MRKIILLIIIILIPILTISQNININTTGFTKYNKSVQESQVITDKSINDWYLVFNTDEFKTNSKYFAKIYLDEIKGDNQYSCDIYIDLESIRNSNGGGNKKIVTVKETYHEKFKDYFSERFTDYFQYDLEFNCTDEGYYYPEKGLRYFTDGSSQNYTLSYYSADKIELIKYAPDGIYNKIYSLICK